MHSWFPLRKVPGYSLIEISFSLLLFSLVLLLAGNSLIQILGSEQEVQGHKQALWEAQNLMEDLLALPVEEAKAFKPEKSEYDIEILWQDYQANKQFEIMTLQYSKNKQAVVQLKAIRQKEQTFSPSELGSLSHHNPAG
jgi:Tfp pilus assembly protein PilV